VFYDDSNITAPSGTTEPQVQLSGCNVPCHSWTNYTTPNATGFGNLNTINTWWFSRQTITENVFPLPSYLECEISGPEEICAGDIDTLNVTYDFLPLQAIAGQIVSYEWQGPGITGPVNTDYILINSGGTYDVTITWLTALGDTCQSFCSHSLEEGEIKEIYIDTLILRGDTIHVNNEAYFENGQYQQFVQTNFGCDSIINITVRIAENILHYDFDNCRSFISDSSHQVYTEFTAKYPNALNCASMTAEFLHREMPVINPHSCTPGVNDSPAMCVSSLDTCDYHAGHDKSIVFEVTLDPDPDTAIMITHLCFYERAPINFEWLNGPTGPNNYPTFYGVRVLKNGTEIYREEDIATSSAWSKETFDFRQLPDFASKEKAVYRFELLGYCLIGDTSKVTAWDLDELSVLAACVSPAVIGSTLSGFVMTDQGLPLNQSHINLMMDNHLNQSFFTSNDTDGFFAFPHLDKRSYTLTATNQNEYLNGVTTADALTILHHLLGKKTLTESYNYIRADVNNSKSISVSDIAELQKLILGKTDKFSSETSWKIINHDPEFPLSTPWSYEDEITVKFDSYDDQEVELLGLKLGDVTGDAQHILAQNKTRNEQIFEISYFDFCRVPGSTFEIPLYVNSNFNLTGLQLALELEGLKLIDVIPNRVALNEESVHIDRNGTLNISWISHSSIVMTKGDILFTLIVQKKDQNDHASSIRLNTDRIRSEVYDDQIESFKIELNQNGELSKISDNAYTLLATPNPFTEAVTFEFTDALENDASLVLRNVNGQQIATYHFKEVKAGHRLAIPASVLNTASGIIFYELRNDQISTTGRLVKVK
jgi:hypothetical protein